MGFYTGHEKRILAGGTTSEGQKNTEFFTWQELWQITFMPFGLCKAPAPLELALRDLGYDPCLVYLDDVIAICSTFKEQLKSLHKLLQRRREAHLKLNPAKFQLLRKEIWYLGHTVSPSRETTEPEKIEAVKNCPRLTGKQQLRGFLWLCTYYRISLPGSRI
jgi:hypothetical protein